ncbi:chitin disaccharide deacetylase [Paucisalibacillus sp. EB02]|uniref:chitin disaccharide deacetylase n=1 Tax=Paucisalibacillus sp. EB02 TaxID=1347087 RepID=UPI0004BB6B46|nr:chitin disaccharide deacetylase [Paucisalibacillus sp. EB02]
MKVLFNADDFGLTKGVTDGIIQAHTKGVVGSTTLMVNGKAFEYAVGQARNYPSLKVGIHLVLTWGKPISNQVPNLLDANGNFKYKSNYLDMDFPNIEDVEKEWRAQIEAFLATGLKLDHIDSHHHVHGWEPLKEVVVKLAQEYNVPVRYVDSFSDYPNLLLTDTLYLDFYGKGIEENIFGNLQDLDVQSVEVMTHPAIIDDELRSVSSYTDKRVQELDILCSLEIPDWVEIL